MSKCGGKGEKDKMENRRGLEGQLEGLEGYSRYKNLIPYKFSSY
jgi:hypothetical protein